MHAKKENGAFGTLSRVHDCHVYHAIDIARRPGPAAAEQVAVAKPVNADQQTGVGCIKPETGQAANSADEECNRPHKRHEWPAGDGSVGEDEPERNGTK